MASGIPKRERLERIKAIIDEAKASTNKKREIAAQDGSIDLTPDDLARIYALACNQPETWRP